MTPAASILIVEDESRWQSSLSDHVLDLGYHPIVAENLNEAIHAINSHLPTLVIVDVRLRESERDNRDGMQVLDYIWKNDLPCKSLIITGYAGDNILPFSLTRAAFRMYRVVDIMPKLQFATEEFRSIVSSIMEKVSHSSELNALAYILGGVDHGGVRLNHDYTLVITIRVDWGRILEERDEIALDIRLYADQVRMHILRKRIVVSRSQQESFSVEFPFTPFSPGERYIDVEFYDSNIWLMSLRKDILVTSELP